MLDRQGQGRHLGRRSDDRRTGGEEIAGSAQLGANSRRGHPWPDSVAIPGGSGNCASVAAASGVGESWPAARLPSITRDAGRYVHERERKLGLKDKSLLAVAYEYGVPIYTSSPGDSSIGMNVAAKALQGNKLAFDPSLDVNETAAIVLAAKREVVAGRESKKGS